MYDVNQSGGASAAPDDDERPLCLDRLRGGRAGGCPFPLIGPLAKLYPVTQMRGETETKRGKSAASEVSLWRGHPLANRNAAPAPGEQQQCNKLETSLGSLKKLIVRHQYLWTIHQVVRSPHSLCFHFVPAILTDVSDHHELPMGKQCDVVSNATLTMAKAKSQTLIA